MQNRPIDIKEQKVILSGWLLGTIIFSAISFAIAGTNWYNSLKQGQLDNAKKLDAYLNSHETRIRMLEINDSITSSQISEVRDSIREHSNKIFFLQIKNR